MNLAAETVLNENIELKNQQMKKTLGALHQYTVPIGENFSLPQGNGAFVGIKSILNLGILSSPIDASTIHFTAPQSPSNTSKIASCVETTQQDAMLEADATVNGSYGAFSGSLSARYERNVKVSSTSSTYMGFMDNSLGTVFVNSDAKLSASALAKLKSSPADFVQEYGQYMVYAYKVGCSFVGEINVYAESESDKMKLDIAAKASYGKMFSADANFKASLDKSGARYSMNASAVATGTSISTSGISDPADIPPIIKQIDADISPKTASLQSVIIGSWLSLQEVADNVPANQLHVFNQPLSPSLLEDYSILYAKVAWMSDYLDNAITNYKTLMLRQWVVPTEEKNKSLKLLKAIRSAVDSKKIQELDKNTESQVATPGYLLHLKEFVDLQMQGIKQVFSVKPFTITISLAVASSYDNYHPKEHYDFKMKIDPATMLSRTKRESINVSNGHSNCRHFYGTVTAVYTDGTDGDGKNAVPPALEFQADLNRVCGSKGNTSPITFTPNGKDSRTLSFDNTVDIEVTIAVSVDP